VCGVCVYVCVCVFVCVCVVCVFVCVCVCVCGVCVCVCVVCGVCVWCVCVCVCSIGNAARNAQAPYYMLICGLPSSTICFQNFLINATIFEIKLLNIKCVF